MTPEHKAALEAAARLRDKLSDRTTTHYSQPEKDRRGDLARSHHGFMARMARKGRKGSPKAKGKKQRSYSTLDFE